MSKHYIATNQNQRNGDITYTPKYVNFGKY
jgi:hypothetical protein